MMFTKRHANSRNAALSPSPEKRPATRAHFAHAAEAAHRVGQRAEMSGQPKWQDVKLAFTAGALGLGIHPLEQVASPLAR